MTDQPSFFRKRPEQPPAELATPAPSQALHLATERPPERKDEPGPVRRLTFHGTGGSLFGIQIVNLFLILVTLGIYSFWGKVRVRDYLLSETELDGDRFAYHGTGRELLIGSLKAALVFGVPIALVGLARDLLEAGSWVTVLLSVLVYGIILVFIAVARVGSRRYRLSRTSWRGVRFSFRGRVVEFLRLYVSGALLTVLTFGFYYPVFAVRQQAFMVSHSFFGNERFAFEGHGRALLGPFVVALLLTIPTLGLCWYWFAAAQHRYYWNHTSVGTARFRSSVTGWQRLRLSLGDLGLLLVTAALGWSWIVVRDVRFFLRYLSLEGPLDLGGIRQEIQPASATGEGLAGFLDTEFDLG